MKTKTIQIKVLRQDPSSGQEPAYQQYTIESYPGMSVLEALQTVYGKVDSTLAIQGYACYRLVCSLCTYRVNGKLVLACRTPVEDGMVIEPPPKRNVIRDLATEIVTER
ncbi:MAG: hypothetical protein GX338_10770 [Firmicutes bacterium]|nr:hypothetical protein [Bacillota bacterium]